ncbi:MAG: tetratricopeptide repeat protein [Phycisphaerales bacterium]|nr:MAG: tetratricopeptide repeat protein [Phycisphaerales bacterium]
MAKRVNKNLAVTLSVLGFVAIIAVSIVMIKQLEQRDPQEYVVRAEQHRMAEEWDQAAMFYSRAYNVRNDPKYLVDQGEMLKKIGNIGGALQMWQLAITQNRELLEAHESQLDVLLALAKATGQLLNWERVRTAAEALLDIQSGHARAHNALGLALVRLRTQDKENEERGVEMLKRAIELAPEKLDYALDLAAYYLLKADEATREMKAEEETRSWVAECDDKLKGLIEQFSSPGPDASRARLQYALLLATPSYREILDKEMTSEEVEEYFRAAIDLAGDDREVLDKEITPEEVEKRLSAVLEAKVGYARYLTDLWRQERSESEEETLSLEHPLAKRAVALLQECIEADEETYPAYLVLGKIYQYAREPEKALQVCENRLRLSGPKRVGLEAGKEIESTFELLLLASENAMAAAMQAREDDDPDKAADRFDKAEQHVEDALSEIPDQPNALAQSGRLKLAQGEDRSALEYLLRADEGFRVRGLVDWNTKTTLAQLHLQLEEPGAAREVLEEGLRRAQPPERDGDRVWALYATLLYLDKEYDQAITYASRALLVNPENADARLIKALSLAEAGREITADELTQGEDQVTRTYIEFQRLEEEGDKQGATEALERLADLRPASKSVLERLVPRYLKQGKYEQAQTVLRRALSEAPDDADIRKMMLAAQPDIPPAERIEKLRAIAESEEDLYNRTLALARFYYGQTELEKALEEINQAEQLIIDQATTSARAAGKAGHREVLSLKMLIAARLDNQQELKAAVDSASENNVDGAYGKTFLGQYHMYREEAELAVVAFNQALQFQPTDATALAYLGRCYQGLGRMGDAEDAYNRAIESNPFEGPAWKGIAQLALVSGDIERYEEALTECERLLPQDIWVQGELQLRAEKADPEAAIARRVASLSENPDDYTNIRRLAQLYEQVEDFDSAEEYNRRLLELDPENADLVLAVSGFYHRAGKPDEALRLLEGYASSRPTAEQRANAMKAIATHYYKLRDYQEMLRVLLEAADLAETFEIVRGLADYYMHPDIKQPRKALPWLDKAVARARLTNSPQLPSTLSARIGCLLHREVNDTETAEARMKEFRNEFPEDPLGLYWESELNARAGRIEEAAQALDHYLSLRPNDPYALYQRARYYLTLGRPGQAIADLETLKREHPDALEYKPRLLLSQLYEFTGKTERALAELSSLMKEQPDSDLVVNEFVKSRMKAGRYSEVERVLTALINSRGEEAKPLWFTLRGRAFAALREYRRALEDYKQTVLKSNYQVGTVASVLQACYRFEWFDEGIKYFEENRSKIPEQFIALSRYAILLARAGREEEAVEEFRSAMSMSLKRGKEATAAVDQAVRLAFPKGRALELFREQLPDPTAQQANDRIFVGALLGSGLVEDAPERIQRLLQLATDDEERGLLYTLEGTIFEGAGEHEKARASYEQAIKYNEKDAIALNNLAYLLSDKLKKPDLALPYAKRAALLMEGLMEGAYVLDTLGHVYVQLGQCKIGIAELSRAVQSNPSLCIARFHLGEAYRQCGEFENARNVLRGALECSRGTGDTQLTERINQALERAGASDNTP